MIVYGAKNELRSKDNENGGTEIKAFSAASGPPEMRFQVIPIATRIVRF